MHEGRLSRFYYLPFPGHDAMVFWFSGIDNPRITVFVAGGVGISMGSQQ